MAATIYRVHYALITQDVHRDFTTIEAAREFIQRLLERDWRRWHKLETITAWLGQRTS